MADRHISSVHILPPDATEAQVAEVQTQIEEVVSRLHGQIASTDNWGRKRLAYEIARHKEGYYVLQTINGSGELDEGAGSPTQGHGHRHPPDDRPRRRGQEGGRHRADQAPAQLERRRVKRGLPPQRQPGEGRAPGEPDDQDDDRFEAGEV